MLLLDEPTNHLDLETTRWLEGYLAGLDATVLLISHDRAFLQAVVDHVLHVEAGTVTPYAGDYEAFVRQRAERRLAQQRAFDKQSKVIASEEDFIRRNIAGQNSAQAKGRRRRLARVSRLSAPEGEDGVMSLRLEADARGGDQVLVAENVRVADRRAGAAGPLLQPVSGAAMWSASSDPTGQGRPRCCGRFVGERPLDAGEVRIPESVQVWPTTARIWRRFRPTARCTSSSTTCGPPGGAAPFRVTSDASVFPATRCFARRQTLSGGERARVALAMMMLSGANLLLFDEPTNHLDVESIEALEDAIESFDGTVILVSHDRALLRALTTRVWVLHEGRITDFPGSFEEWETASAERAHAASVAASEEETLRRVHERKQTRRPMPAASSSRLGEAPSGCWPKRSRAWQSGRPGWLRSRAQLEDPGLYLTREGRFAGDRHRSPVGRGASGARACLHTVGGGLPGP